MNVGGRHLGYAALVVVLLVSATLIMVGIDRERSAAANRDAANAALTSETASLSVTPQPLSTLATSVSGPSSTTVPDVPPKTSRAAPVRSASSTPTPGNRTAGSVTARVSSEAASATNRPVAPTVAPGTPDALTVSCRGEELIATQLAAMNYDGGDINPPTGRQAYYLQNWGESPRTPSRDSFFVFGHSWTQDPLEVFNALSTRAYEGRGPTRTVGAVRGGTMRVQDVPDLTDGCTATVATSTGVFTYEFTSAYVMPKSEWNNDAALADDVPGRMVLVTCLIDQRRGVEVDQNLTIFARLVQATATS